MKQTTVVSTDRLPDTIRVRNVKATVDEYIAALPADQRDTADAVRPTVLGAESDISESIKWGQPVFDVNGPVAALKAHAHHVTLTFWRGAALDSAATLLEGDGDRMRHARFTNVESIPTEVI